MLAENKTNEIPDKSLDSKEIPDVDFNVEKENTHSFSAFDQQIPDAGHGSTARLKSSNTREEEFRRITGTELPENITESRILKRNILILARSRLKSSRETDQMKRRFIETQTKKTQSMPNLLQKVDLDQFGKSNNLWVEELKLKSSNQRKIIIREKMNCKSAYPSQKSEQQDFKEKNSNNNNLENDNAVKKSSKNLNNPRESQATLMRLRTDILKNSNSQEMRSDPEKLKSNMIFPNESFYTNQNYKEDASKIESARSTELQKKILEKRPDYICIYNNISKLSPCLNLLNSLSPNVSQSQNSIKILKTNSTLLSRSVCNSAASSQVSSNNQSQISLKMIEKIDYENKERKKSKTLDRRSKRNNIAFKSKNNENNIVETMIHSIDSLRPKTSNQTTSQPFFCRRFSRLISSAAANKNNQTDFIC